MIKRCNRCGEKSMEVFRTHQYCSVCNYGNEENDDHPTSSIEWLDRLIRDLTEAVEPKNIEAEAI